TTINSSHLELCQCWPLVMPGLLMLMLTWPQSAVCTSSVKEPLSSTFIFSGYLNFSAGRYVRYRLYSFFAKEPSGIFGIIRVDGCCLNCSSRSTISPSVTLWVIGTQQ